jgi:hypothetical protein
MEQQTSKSPTCDTANEAASVKQHIVVRIRANANLFANFLQAASWFATTVG